MDSYRVRTLVGRLEAALRRQRRQAGARQGAPLQRRQHCQAPLRAGQGGAAHQLRACRAPHSIGLACMDPAWHRSAHCRRCLILRGMHGMQQGALQQLDTMPNPAGDATRKAAGHRLRTSALGTQRQQLDTSRLRAGRVPAGMEAQCWKKTSGGVASGWRTSSSSSDTRSGLHRRLGSSPD